MEFGMLSLVFSLVFLESAGQFLARKYKDNKEKLWLFMLPIFCYITIVYVLVKTYDIQNIGFVNALWSGLTIVVVTILGYFFFEERFSIIEIIAISLIFVGTIILGLQKREEDDMKLL